MQDGADQGLVITPIAGALGAEVTGIDLAQVDDAAFTAVYRAFLDHQVLAFRDQRLAPADYVALARRFGTPAEYPFAKGLKGFP